MSIAQILNDVAPEFIDIDSGLKNRIIEYASAQLSESKMGKHYELSVAYLAAHMLTLRDRQGKGGAVSSASEGQLSLAFQITAASPNQWNQTSYGAELRGLIRRSAFTPRTRYGL
jgi:hypothetical protein